MRQAAQSLGILNAVGVVKSQPSPLSGQKMISGLREGAPARLGGRESLLSAQP